MADPVLAGAEQVAVLLAVVFRQLAARPGRAVPGRRHLLTIHCEYIANTARNNAPAPHTSLLFSKIFVSNGHSKIKLPHKVVRMLVNHRGTL